MLWSNIQLASGNQVADWLARDGKSGNSKRCANREDLLSWLCGALRLDKTGVPYLRK